MPDHVDRGYHRDQRLSYLQLDRDHQGFTMMVDPTVGTHKTAVPNWLTNRDLRLVGGTARWCPTVHASNQPNQRRQQRR